LAFTGRCLLFTGWRLTTGLFWLHISCLDKMCHSIYISFGKLPLMNIQVIQRFQNKVLKCIVKAPWYIRNNDLHQDLRIETVTDIITKLANSHKKRFQNHINNEVSRLLSVQNIPRRLKRKKPFNLVKQ
jgi:hypothetical protein